MKNRNVALSQCKPVLSQFLILLLLLNPLAAQLTKGQTQFTVRGNVVDPTRGPVSNVTVTEKGTSNSVTTDNNGYYQLNVSSGSSVLVFTYPLSWNEEVPVNNRSVINIAPKCNVGSAAGGTWSGNGCSKGDVVTVGRVGFGCPAGKKQAFGSTECLPEVKFQPAENVTLDAAQAQAIQNGRVLATPEEIYEAWKDLKYEKKAYGILYDGSHALPIQGDEGPWKHGANVGIPAPKTQGYFYVDKQAVSRSQTPPPTATTCKETAVNPMIDGWASRDPLILEAGREMLRKEGKAVTGASLGALASQVQSDPVMRWRFAPFMLRIQWKAITATSPNPAQDQFRRKFESWVACDELQIARQTLALWNAHIGKTWTSYPQEYCSGKKEEATTFSGEKVLVEEPCQQVSVHFMAPVTGYQYNTLGVLIDTRQGGKWTTEGFLPLDNPQFLGPNGREAMNLLLKPVLIEGLPEADDTQNLRGLGNEMELTAQEAGITVGGMAAVTAVVGSTILGHAVFLTNKAVFDATENAAIRTKTLIESLIANGRTASEATKEAAEAGAKNLPRVTARAVGKNFLKSILTNGFEKSGTKAGEVVAKKLAQELFTKVGSVVAVLGIIATFGEIFGTVVADSVRTQEFDRNVNEAAKALKPFSVRETLGSGSGLGDRAFVFTKLMKMTVTDPADKNKLTLALPPLDCPSGSKESNIRTCVTEVKFHSQAGLTLAQAREVASRNGWSLATPSEVESAWLGLDLNAYSYGRMADGRFAVPVQSDTPNFKLGANIGATGGNQGFFYTTSPVAANSPGLSWNRLTGTMKQVSVGSDGTAWALDSSDRIFRWNGSGWANVPGGLKQISVGSEHNVWGVNGSDEIFRWNGTGWELIAGRLKHVSVGSDGTVWGVNSADQIWRWNGSGWEGNIPGRLKQISVGGSDHIWGINVANQIYRWNGTGWTQVPGVLKYVSAGSDGSVWGVNPSNEIFMWNGGSWTKIPGGLNQISSGGSGNVWGVNQYSQIYSRSFKGGVQTASSTAGNAPAASPSTSASSGTTWKLLPGAMKNVSVGSDGTTWALDTSDRIYKWNGSAWTVVPGGLKQISVGSASHVWGVNGSNAIYRWNGSSWDRIAGILKHVSVGSDGTVWGVNPSDQIWRWNGSGWEGNIPGRLKQISVGNSRLIWGVNASNEVFRWNGAGWTRVPGNLKYVSVGSDGTVWGIDSNNQIFIRQGDSWKQIAGGLNQISVGGASYVWGVNKYGQIFSRSF